MHESASPVTLPIGSKRFIEGWNCWRVSSLGLMQIAFHRTVKESERRLGDPQVTLEAWIVTPTSHAELDWGVDLDALEREHVLCVNDLPDS